MKKILVTIKKALTENILLKLFSVVLAIFAWLTIVNVSDPSITRTINNIPIIVTQEDAITSSNMTYSLKSDDTATVVVTGKRSIVSQLTKRDFIATAPLSEMSQVFAVPVYVEIRNAVYQNYVAINQKTHTISIEVEDVITQSYDVDIKYEGEPSSGYVLGDSSLGRTKVDITAPNSKHNLISKVAVEIDVTDATENVSGKFDIKIFKADGTEINDPEIEVSARRTKVNVQILKTKELPIIYEVKGEPADGYVVTDVETSAVTVKVCGSEEAIEDCESIVLETDFLDITDKKESVSKTVDLLGYLPEGVEVYDANSRVFTVKAIIEELVGKNYEIGAGDIKFTNIPTGCSANLVRSNIRIRVMALQHEIDVFNVNEAEVYIDLSRAKPGVDNYEVTIVLPDGYSVNGKIMARVRVTKKENN